MVFQNDYSPEELNQKLLCLGKARHTLKQEFIGIDSVIDNVIDHISNWFLFPELQDRPVIINLWGMTGVGKTALIIRLAELLDFNNRFFRYDMGSNGTDSKSLREVLKKIFRRTKNNSYIIMLDEFQHAKTKDEEDREISNDYSRVVWDLLDSGKFQSGDSDDNLLEKLTPIRNILTQAMSLGVEVSEGIVTKGEDVFVQLINQYMENDFDFFAAESAFSVSKDDKTCFELLPKTMVPALHSLFKTTHKNIFDFKKYLNTLSLGQFLEFIDKAIEKNISYKWIDCSKSVIFILGNLDEAFSMSSSYNPDYSADDFHAASLKININHIKRALRRRFRNEQIARLGNNHIIYPAFSSENFRRLVRMQLDNCNLKCQKEFGIQLDFTQEFRDLIYQEGVYPSQGSRPLFSTIYQMVDAQLPQIFSEIILNHLEIDSILFDFAEGRVTYKYFKNKNQIHQKLTKIELRLGSLRKPGKDDAQAIVAVHESGHIVLSIAALKIIPDYVCSTTADTESSGFMSVSNNKRKYLSKEMVIPKIAECLAGLAAEKIVFGDQYITTGSQEDLDVATTIAAKSVKDYGFGNLKAVINVASLNSKNEWHDIRGEMNQQVKELVQQGWALAEKILAKEKTLLLQLSDFLSEERIIKKDQILDFVHRYGTNEICHFDFEDDRNYNYYRAKLKEQLRSLPNDQPVNQLLGEASSFSLNKKM